MNDFLSKNMGWMVTIILGFASWIVTLGIAYYRLAAVEKQIADMQEHGTRHSREAITTLELTQKNQTSELTEIKADTKSLLKAVEELSKNLAVFIATTEVQHAG